MNGPLFFGFRDKLFMLYKPCRYWISLRAAWLRRSESPENCQPQTGGYRWFRMVGKCYQLRKPFFFLLHCCGRLPEQLVAEEPKSFEDPAMMRWHEQEKSNIEGKRWKRKIQTFDIHWPLYCVHLFTFLCFSLEQFFPSLCVRRAHMITYAYYAYWSNTEVKQLCRHKA